MELLLTLADGSALSVRFSPGVERFIGLYPRIEAFEGAGPLLSYRSAGRVG